MATGQPVAPSQENS